MAHHWKGLETGNLHQNPACARAYACAHVCACACVHVRACVRA